LSFLSTAFLYGLAAAAIPLVIHLIHKQRYPERAFTTLRFFDKTIKNNTIQRRLIDKLLLLLRIALLIALMLGLARPFWNAPLGEQRGSFVIVLDNSPSMSRERDGKTLFAHAKLAAAAVLAKLAASDRAEILFTSTQPQAPLFTREEIADELFLRQGQPTGLLLTGDKGMDLALPELRADSAHIHTALKKMPSGKKAALAGFDTSAPLQLTCDHARLLQSLQHSRISALPGNIQHTLAAAAQLLRTSQDGDRKLILISDFQKSEWRNEPPASIAGLSLLAISVEPPAAGTNLGLENCSVPAREADFGQTVVGTATVKNYGSHISDASTLTVACGDRGKPSEVKLPPIQPGSAMLVSFPIPVMSSERNMLCQARIAMPADPFAYDDNWYFQLGVRFPVATLLVNGVPSENAAGRETFFLANALVPRAGTGQSNAADARECELADLKDRRLAEFGVLILAGVPALDAEAREKIRQFASDGKSVLVFPGANSTADECNAWGFLPAQVGEKKSQSFVYLKSINEKSAAMAGIQERVGAGIHSLSTSSRFMLDPAAQSTVLARFSDGSPALVEGRIGKGRIVLAATGAHASASDWPLRPAFVILVRNLVKYLGTDALPSTLQPERTVGEGASTFIPRELAAGTPAAFRLVSAAAASYEPLAWMRTDRALILPSATTEGHYLITMQPGVSEGVVLEPKVGCSSVPVSVNHSARESTLDSVTDDELMAMFPAGSASVQKFNSDMTPILADLRTGRDVWRYILFAALCLLILESLLAWRTPSEAAN